MRPGFDSRTVQRVSFCFLPLVAPPGCPCASFYVSPRATEQQSWGNASFGRIRPLCLWQPRVAGDGITWHGALLLLLLVHSCPPLALWQPLRFVVSFLPAMRSDVTRVCPQVIALRHLPIALPTRCPLVVCQPHRGPRSRSDPHTYTKVAPPLQSEGPS